MKHIYLRRFLSKKDYTLGLLFIDGMAQCFILEDEKRSDKVYGETRIPAGGYEMQLRTTGGFHERYTNRFADDPELYHRGMLHIVGVPGFTYVLIHIGNDDDDTAGCLLAGSSANLLDGNFVGYSEDAYKKIYPMVADPLSNGENVILHVDKVRM